MAGSVIGALRVNLGLDSAQFTRGATQAQKRLNSMRTQFLAVTGVVAAFGAALTGVAMRGAADIDRIVKGARRIDGSAGALQALELAASEAGVSISALTNDVQTMNRELSSGSAGAQRAMQRLGMSAQELMGMDADERVAAIADRVKELGLSAGEATVLLRDLGIRNREMALLMIQGGDAIRRARDDVRDYGLEIDDALGAKIETARDQIGRLGVVTQYFGQRLAAEVVPALGAFSQAITDSMRDGGALRAMIDGLVNNLQLLTTIAGVAVVAFGTRYVVALVAARVATMGLSGALVLLRTALMRTGIGALIVGAGVLVDFLIRLRTATGSWGESLEALGTLAHEVWEGIKTGAGALYPALQAVFFRIQQGWGNMLAWMSGKFADFMRGLAPLASLPEFGITAPFQRLGQVAVDAASAVNDFQSEANAAGAAAAFLEQQAGQSLRAGLDRAKAALDRLNEVVSDNTEGTTEAADAARELAAELDGLAGGGGGGGSGGARAAADAIDKVTRATEDAAHAQEQWAQSMAGHFDGLITGGKNLRGVLMSIARQLESRGWQQLFSGLGSWLFGGGVGAPLNAMGSGPLAGFRADGGPVSAGKSYIVGERGPELFTPRGSGQITSNEALRGGSNEPVQVVVRLLPSGEFDARVENTARAVVRVERGGIVSDAVSATYRAADEVPIGIR